MVAKSHPTYDKYYKTYGAKPTETIQERMKDFKAVSPYSKEGQQLQRESADRHGRGWWIFQGTSFRSHRRLTWIEQFRKIDGETNE
tara:strand:+ start:3423 stop:3680 length:258 start_codon:yes stop_codon:yes gene_type:complete